MAAVQFIGVDAVLNAYNARQVPVWAIFQSRDLNNVGDSAEELEQYLKMLQPASGTTTYTLKVYSKIDDPDDINEKTPCNGSFKFSLMNAAAQVGGMAPVKYAGVADTVAAKIQGVITDEVEKAIDKRLNGGGDEKEETFTDIIMGYVREPEKLIGVINAVKGLMNNNPVPAMAAIAGLGDAVRPSSSAPVKKAGVKTDEELADEIADRVATVLDRLERHDPAILEHLEKLATIAETKPELFKMLISNLGAL